MLGPSGGYPDPGPVTVHATAAPYTARLPGRYWRLWSATVVSGLGDGAAVAALPLLAVSLTRDPRLVAAVSTAAYLPWLLFSLVAGAMADRVERRRLMWSAQLVQAAAMAVIAAAAAGRVAGIWLLCGVAFALGVAETVFDNASQSVLPQVVEKPQLPRANAAQYAGQTVTESFVGPPIGSLLFAASAGLPFAVDAVSFVLSAALIARLRLRPAGPVAVNPDAMSPDTARPGRRISLRADIVGGLRWLFAHRVLRTLAVLLGVSNFCNQLAYATLVLLATHTFGLSARAYGLLLAGQAVGAVVGSLVNEPVARALGPRGALVAALSTTGLAYLGAGLAPDAVVLGGLLALSGVASTVWNVVTVSLRQQVVPAQLLGRVNSAYRTIGWGMIPLGGVAGGFVAQVLGLRASFLVAGGLRLTALLAAAPLLVAAGRRLGATVQ